MTALGGIQADEHVPKMADAARATALEGKTAAQLGTIGSGGGSGVVPGPTWMAAADATVGSSTPHWMSPVAGTLTILTIALESPIVGGDMTIELENLTNPFGVNPSLSILSGNQYNSAGTLSQSVIQGDVLRMVVTAKTGTITGDWTVALSLRDVSS